MAHLKLPRRTLIASGPVALLLAPILRRAEADGIDQPRRFMTIFTPNGLNYLDAGPSGGETDFTLGDYYAPIEPHRDDLISLTGMYTGGLPYGNNTQLGHMGGGMGCLTCTPDENTGFATGPSIDQFIAKRLFEQGLAPTSRSPVFAVGVSGVSGYAHHYFEAAGEPVPLVNNPVEGYETLFTDLTPEQAELVVARKKSVLDVTYGECKSYLPNLPSEGRAQLDYHCERIRELEQNLEVFECTPPSEALAAVEGLDHNDPDNYPAVVDFWWDMLEVALLCDLTRVASFSFGWTASRFRMPWVNAPVIGQVDTGEENVRDHHSHTHAGTRDTVGLFMTWYATKIAEFVERLATPQPDGTCLLESTTALWTTEYGAVGAHSNSNIPNFIFGSAQGQFQTGRHYELDNDAANSHAMMVSLIQAMGITGVDQFGHPGGGSGPLPQISG